MTIYVNFSAGLMWDEKTVNGLIIALEDDKNLGDALAVASNIKFMKYEVKFNLVEWKWPNAF